MIKHGKLPDMGAPEKVMIKNGKLPDLPPADAKPVENKAAAPQLKEPKLPEGKAAEKPVAKLDPKLSQEPIGSAGSAATKPNKLPDTQFPEPALAKPIPKAADPVLSKNDKPAEPPKPKLEPKISEPPLVKAEKPSEAKGGGIFGKGLKAAFEAAVSPSKENKPAEPKPAEPKPAEQKPVETKESEVKSIETKPAEAKAAAAKSADAKPADTPPLTSPKAVKTAEDDAAGAGDGQNTAASATPAKPPMRLGEKLVGLGLISADQLQIALTEQKSSKKLFGAILVEMGFITESALGEVLAESSGTQKFDPKATMLDSSIVRRIPKDIAVRHKVIPVAFDKDTLQLAMADVYNVLAIDQVRRHLPKNTKIVPIYCTDSEILELIDQYYDYEVSVDGILKEIETGIRDNTKLDGRQEGYVNPTVRLVNALLVDAIKAGASDIHFEPEGSFLRLRHRIDGQMLQVRSFHRDYWSAMVVRIKIMAGMNIAETRNPQDGRISYNVLGREVDFRVATQPTVHGENIVMRLLDKARSLVPLENLGFSDHNITVLKKLLKRPEGIIIVTGPTGSGKTTTLYSVLSYINGIDTNIMTLEDPVEYQLPLIRQSNVREGTGLDFLNGIKSLMRQDPDIIFVGEVRDEDTALMAVRAALTGHQVYTTLHTNDALGAIPRLGDIGVPAHLLAGSLIGCMAQRLSRKLCMHCRKPYTATPEECRILGIASNAKPPTIYKAGGCEKCGNKGYKGRTAIVEVLRVDRGLDELIATHATRRAMLDYALANGFVTMQQDGINKVLAGEITLDELISTIDLTDRL